NSSGQLGNGTTIDQHAPMQVCGPTAVAVDGTCQDGTSTPAFLSSVKALAAGGGHSLALKKDGTVWAWGHNDVGQLGDGTVIDRHAPVQVCGATSIATDGSCTDGAAVAKFLIGVSEI